MSVIALSLSGLLALAPAQSAGDAQEIEPESSPAFTTKTKLAVMTLGAAGVPDEYGAGLTETIATAASRTGVFDTLSPRQISSLLAFEKRKELLGGCVQEACYVQIAQIVKARHLIGGSVTKVGKKIALNLVLIDAAEGKALKRTSREMTSASKLMDEARHAVIVLLQPVLTERQGYLKVAVNVPDAGLSVDDERRSEQSGQVIALAAGPHVLKIVREGFYTTTADVFIRPGRVTSEEVKLIPAKETIEDYESNADLMRYGAYGTAIVAVGAGVLAGVFYAQATDDKNAVDSYSNALTVDRVTVPRADVIAREDSFSTNQAIYLTFLGSAVVSGGVSLYLFLAGEDPDRYEEFHTMSGM